VYTQKSREVQVQSAILDYLSAKRHFYFRTNNIPVFDKSRGTFRALPKHTPRGIADIIVVHVGRPYFLKLKRPGGLPTTGAEGIPKAGRGCKGLCTLSYGVPMTCRNSAWGRT
jgi:hypothetical protein